MYKISGRIGKETVESTFESSNITFTGKKLNQKIKNIWFVYFQRMSKTLKSCDAIFFNGTDLVEFVVEQKEIEKITDIISYPCYMGGMDPLPWKKMCKTAEKNNWTLEDWQHVLEDEESDEESDSDADWVPDSEQESSDEDSDEDSDEEPSAKRHKRS
tara:strand:+ start:2227 stop:2700 length:474 start_codon:yes stop_codon:yes gene_type:complete